MPDTEDTTQTEKDLYKTIFNKSITYKITDFVSAVFLYGIVDAIAKRMKIDPSEIETEFSLDDGASIRVSGKTNIENLLKDSQKYGRRLSAIEISSGIIYAVDDKSTHFSLSFDLHRRSNYIDTGVRAYAVANDRKNSEHVIDWGNGVLKDFQNLSLLKQTPQKGEFVIKLDNGSITTWSIDNSIQKVEVVNQIETAPSKLSDKTNVLSIIGIIVAIVAIILAILSGNQA